MARIRSVEVTKIAQFDTVVYWFGGLEQIAKSRGKKELTQSAKDVRLSVMHAFQRFTGKNPDQLIEETKQDIKIAMSRIDGFFNYLQKEKGLQWNSAVTQLGFMRGFYTHNDFTFPKRYPTPKRKVSQVSQRDQKTKIYDYDEATDKMIFHNGTIQHFIQNLNFRDQTITLCLLSTGADTADLLQLNLDFVKDAKGKISKVKRFLWNGNREKDGVEFKVYFSEEATQFLKRYVEQERASAKNNEPLFEDKKNKRLKVHALGINFRGASQKMGYIISGNLNPFRPKRFRHLFRTACSNAKVDSGFIMSMMGHASNVSASYLEKSVGLLLKEYVRIEPYVTVFGIDKSSVTVLSEEVQNLNTMTLNLAKENQTLKSQMKKFRKEIKSIVDMNYKEFQEFRAWFETKQRVEEQKDVQEERKEIQT